MENLELSKAVGNAIYDKKGKDVTIIGIGNISSFADYFVNATAINSRMLDAIKEEVDKVFDKEGITAKSIEGKASSGWILADYGDIIVNIFSEEQRDKYQLDKIWSDGELIKLENEE